jgi:hypothetical protein
MTEDELLALARHESRLGLPIGRTRFRFVKRAFARLLWLTNSHQVAFNDAVLQVLERMRGENAHLRLVISQEIAEVHSEIAEFAEADSERNAALGAALARLDLLMESSGVEPVAATTERHRRSQRGAPARALATCLGQRRGRGLARRARRATTRH